MFDQYNIELEKFNEKFVNYFKDKNTFSEILNYSIEKGKRLRAILLLKTYEMISKKNYSDTIFNFAVALELIHNYSLIHDDLPSMDNDDYRRGRMTTHKCFGESMAILAGDALLNYAYELLLKTVLSDNSENNIKAALNIAENAGYTGMILGQIVDVNEEANDIESIISMYKNKTCGLIVAATKSAAFLANASEEIINEMEKLGFYIGMAFQIQDDLLDYENDKVNDKNTYIKYKGYESAKEDMIQYTKSAEEILCKYDSDFIKTLLLKLINRVY